MTILPSLLIAGAALLTCQDPVPEAPAQQPRALATEQTDEVAALAAFLEEQIEGGRYAGAVALVERDGRTVLDLAAGEGRADEPMEQDAIFRIYSMTKAVTAAAAMSLVEDKLLDLDAPVGKYLPELAEVEVLVEAGKEGGKDELLRVPCERPMLVRDLMTHTSGYTYGFFGDTPADRLMRRAMIFAPGVTNETMVERLEGVPLKHQPGTRFEYGISSDVLGRVLEVAGEKPLDEIFRERFFKPLGMVDTAFEVPEAKRARVATCYVREDGELRPARAFEALDPASKTTHHSGGGGLYSTARDYMAFCRMLLDGGRVGELRVLEEASVAEMMRDHLDGRPAPMLAWTGGAFGYGMAVLDAKRRRGPQKGTVWWGGIAGTAFWIDPASKTIGVFMIQTMNEVNHSTTFRSRVYRAMGR